MLNRRSFLTISASSALAAPFLSISTPAFAHEISSQARKLPAASKHRVGSVEITVLFDGTIDVGPELIVGFDKDKADATLKKQHLPPFDKTRPLPVLGHVIDTGDKKIAVDTGTLAGFSPNTGGFHQALHEAGIATDDIDTVLLTHLHPDHVGGLTADGNPLFANAEIVVNETEWDFWHGAAADALPDQMQPFVQMARGMTLPYKDKLRTFSGDAEVLPGIQALQLPGHTPGHVGYSLHSDGDSLLFWGDVIHLPRLQFDNPDWLVAFDMDPAQTSATRAKMLDMAAADGMRVTGTHLELPSFGYVDRTSSGYQFVQAPFDYNL